MAHVFIEIKNQPKPGDILMFDGEGYKNVDLKVVLKERNNFIDEMILYVPLFREPTWCSTC